LSYLIITWLNKYLYLLTKLNKYGQ
jgi:hypothetical protein